MNDRQLSTFVEVVHAGSFTKAEIPLFLSRQAIRKQIDALEQELGVTLFLRGNHGLTLTEEGRIFYEGAYRISNDLQTLVDKCRSSVRQRICLRIGVPNHPHHVLEQAFQAFSLRFPNISLDLTYMGRASEYRDKLLSGVLDVAERALAEPMDDPNIGYFKLADLGYNCVMSISHPLAKKSIISFEDLRSCNIGLRTHGSEKLVAMLNERCRDANIVNNNGHDLQQIIKLCYSQHVCISRSYYLAFMGSLAVIPLDFDDVATSYLMYRKPPAPLAKQFIELVKEIYPITLYPTSNDKS